MILGAGLGGLCCGAYLAKQGVPVTVVEQRAVPGGYACCFERAGGGFTFVDTTLIYTAEEVMRGLSSMIEVEEVATPLTNWRFTRNTDGAIYGLNSP